MNYQEEDRELDREIQAELRRLEDSKDQPFPNFSDPSELQSFLKNLPVRKEVRSLPLSSYLRQFRKYLRTSLDDFAAALKLPRPSLEELESGESVPWTSAPSLVAQVAESLRLHIAAVELLVKNSHTIGRVSGLFADPDSAKDAMLSWLERVRVELQNRGADDLLE